MTNKKHDLVLKLKIYILLSLISMFSNFFDFTLCNQRYWALASSLNSKVGNLSMKAAQTRDDKDLKTAFA